MKGQEDFFTLLTRITAMISFPRVASYLALLLPLTAACLVDDHVVGTDDDAGVDSGTKSDGGSSCEGQAALPCAPVPGCSWEGPTCVDDHVTCGTLVCSDGGSSCEGQVAPPCPAASPGCSWEGPECVNGHLGCGVLVCSDAGGGAADGGDQVCHTNADCTGGAQCFFAIGSCAASGVCQVWPAPGTAECNSVERVCGCDGTQVTTGCDAPTGYATGPTTGGQGDLCTLDAGGSRFSCGSGSLTCDSATQYCYIFQGGPINPDGGTNGSTSCNTIPAACADDTAGVAASCACTKTQDNLSGVCSENGNSFTITLDAP
jgi:hypothetical protein